MKFDKLCKIHEAAAKDETRYALTDILFERDDDGARLVATDGRILAVVPVTDADGDEPGLVSREAVAESTKDRTKYRAEADLRLPDDKRSLVFTKHGMTEIPRVTERGGFPDYRGVCKEPKGNLKVTLSASLLLRLAKAIGAMGTELDGITLHFHGRGTIDPEKPAKATPVTGEAFGYIMPISEGSR